MFPGDFIQNVSTQRLQILYVHLSEISWQQAAFCSHRISLCSQSFLQSRSTYRYFKLGMCICIWSRHMVGFLIHFFQKIFSRTDQQRGSKFKMCISQWFHQMILPIPQFPEEFLQNWPTNHASFGVYVFLKSLQMVVRYFLFH